MLLTSRMLAAKRRGEALTAIGDVRAPSEHEGERRDMKDGDLGETPAPCAEHGASSLPNTVRSEQLLAGGRPLAIAHNGETYWLRRTSKGKLILTK